MSTQTPRPVVDPAAVIGAPIEWHSVQRCHRSAFSTSTHEQAFAFTIDGKPYWGHVYRCYDKHASTGGQRAVTYDVELRSKDKAGRSYAVGETHKAAWRGVLIAAFRKAMIAWCAEQDRAHDIERAASVMPHVTAADRKAVAATVRVVLAHGYSVSVSDGEERVCDPTQDHAAIIKAMGSTGQDLLALWRPDGVRVGTFALIYGMTDAAETVADYSWRRATEGSEATMDALWGEIVAASEGRVRRYQPASR